MAINKTFQIIRKDISSYQGANFSALEKKHLEIIPEVLYSTEERSELKKIYITNSNSTLKDLESREDIALIIHPNSGYDNFPTNFVKNAKYPIITGNKIRMNAVVGYIMSALLSHSNKLPSSREWDHSRKWSRTLLSERKVLIIGHGHIGKRIELMLKTMGCTPEIYDPFKGHDNLDPTGIEVVIMACGLNPTSEKIVSKSFLEKLAPYYLLINSARGNCVDQEALCDSLLANKRAFAYLDVFEKEPFDKSQFIGIDNIELTSHVAGVHNTLNTSILNFEWNVVNDFIHKCPTIEAFKEKYTDSLLQNKIKEDFLI